MNRIVLFRMPCMRYNKEIFGEEYDFVQNPMNMNLIAFIQSR